VRYRRKKFTFAILSPDEFLYLLPLYCLLTLRLLARRYQWYTIPWVTVGRKLAHK